MRKEIGYLVEIYSGNQPKDDRSAAIKRDLYFFTDKEKGYEFQDKKSKDDVFIEAEDLIRCTTFSDINYYSTGSVGDEIYMINIEETDCNGPTSLKRFYGSKEMAEEILFFSQQYDTGNCICENYYRHTEMISIPVNIEF